jgi:hypothetical protein
VPTGSITFSRYHVKSESKYCKSFENETLDATVSTQYGLIENNAESDVHVNFY